MDNYQNDIDVNLLKLQLAEARANLEQIRIEFKDESALLNIYEPSAKHFVVMLENTLIELASQEYGIALQPSINESSKVDIWVSLEGEEFRDGKGPIGQVGSFLTRLYNANRQATAVVSGKRGKSKKPSEMPGLCLVTTKAGSLKLGLHRPEIKLPSPLNQLELFEEDSWDQCKDIIKENELPAEGMQLLLKSIASVQDDKILGELMETYSEQEIIKILHYAKELAPSAQSPIDCVRFEGDYVDNLSRSMKTDKETRKKLTQHASKLLPTTMYVEGTAYIGQADVSGYLVARPLKYSGITHQEVRCVFTKELEPEVISLFLNKNVSIKGFMVSDRNEKLLRLEVDEIELLHQALAEIQISIDEIT